MADSLNWMIFSGVGVECFSTAVLLSLVPVVVVVTQLIPHKGTAVSFIKKAKNIIRYLI